MYPCKVSLSSNPWSRILCTKLHVYVVNRVYVLHVIQHEIKHNSMLILYATNQSAQYVHVMHPLLLIAGDVQIHVSPQLQENLVSKNYTHNCNVCVQDTIEGLRYTILNICGSLHP